MRPVGVHLVDPFSKDRQIAVIGGVVSLEHGASHKLFGSFSRLEPVDVAVSVGVVLSHSVVILYPWIVTILDHPEIRGIGRSW